MNKIFSIGKFLNAFLCLLIITSLINSSSWFIYPSLASLFAYEIIGALLLTFCGLSILVHLKKARLLLPLPSLLFVLFGLFVFLHGYFLFEYLNQRHIYLILMSLLGISIPLCFANQSYKAVNLLWIICIASVAESLICMAQFAGWLKTANSYFKVTGTWSNPNVTAMFLAMSLPAMLSLYFSGTVKAKKTLTVILCFLVFALVLLKCRTAYIGSGLASALVMNHHFDLLNRFKDKRNRAGAILLGGFVFLILVSLALHLYNSKKASADGRKLVWKISLDMISARPFTGYGYGRFEHDYNLEQARKVSLGQLSGQELRNADYVRMAYNEFLENTVEGGMAGFVIFSALLLSLLRVPPVRKILNQKLVNHKSKTSEVSSEPDVSIAAYAGIAAFAIMSVFNFTMQAVPLMCLFVCYAGLYPLTGTGGSPQTIRPRILLFCKPALASIFMFAGLWMFYQQILNAHAHIQNKQAADLLKTGQYEKAKVLLDQLNPALSHSESYWTNFGKMSYHFKDYATANAAYQRALKFTSNPELYFISGTIYEKSHAYSAAVSDYLIAKNIQPSRFKYRFALMNGYLKTGNHLAAGSEAREILTLQPKIPSPEVEKYKSAAKLIMAGLGIPVKPLTTAKVNFQFSNRKNQ